MDLGLEMFKKAKINLLPAFSRSRPDKVDNVHPTEKQVGYYPGCSLHSMAKEFDHSFKAVTETLDLELVEPKGWTCCGASPAHHVDHYLGVKAPMVNLSVIEASGFEEVVAPCAACFNRFRRPPMRRGRTPNSRSAWTGHRLQLSGFGGHLVDLGVAGQQGWGWRRSRPR